MLEPESEQLSASAIRVTLRWHGAPLSVRGALELCGTDELFRGQLIELLAASPFVAYFWETPPITQSSLDRSFEFVLSESRGLARAEPDSASFSEHFAADHDLDGIVTFENLGRDATLIVPCPVASESVYAHLAAFVRGAPGAQVHALFRHMGDEVLSRVSDRPLWLSTAGMGVHWLHMRVDSRPKYYRHTPYKEADR